MTARTFRPTLEALEDRRTPATLTGFPAQLGGNSAVTLLTDVRHPPNPIAPEVVTIYRLLPNGVIQAIPPQPIVPPNPIAPSQPIHDLFPPGPDRGLLQAADVSSDAFIAPITIGTGGTT
jgi:hypothetical protein